ncbi:hypothetical protein BCR34DRAFT_510328 [Clohesyomyces aquaticus]|uniref:Ribosomal protein S15 n=1 Tax=Clohesyomyces aquaticus TaxID=1231657 RepID=A0A1Y1ZUX7_9PLEO|nr:hypothetical protein BCR34DRAFT_510328 [Clohesyomyces aquaticus]
MPPRIRILTCLRATKSPSTIQYTLPIRTFASTPAPSSQKSASRKRMTHDPYIIAQRDRKKAANLSRRAALLEQYKADLGDPVRGIPTPFVDSFDTGTPLTHPPEAKIPRDETHLNYALKPQDVEKSLSVSQTLAVPRVERKVERGDPLPYSSGAAYGSEPSIVETAPEDVAKQQAEDHQRAATAIERITALANGSSKDRMRVNITRCINTFGRHRTDFLLPPRAPGLASIHSTAPAPIRPETNAEAAKKRVGPDTGSSEVQIAILTAKIKTLAEFLETRGKGDKHNKRNLRLLVHRRQKLLQYLKRKERGGPRWQHCVEMLGLTEGMWKGEITL